MEIQQIIELVETRFLPLIHNITSPLTFKIGDVAIDIQREHVHVIYMPLHERQFVLVSTADWTSVKVCPNHIQEDDLVVVHDSLIEIWETNITNSKILRTKKEQIEEKIKELKRELSVCE